MTGLIWAASLFFLALIFRIAAIQAKGFEKKLRCETETFRPEVADKLRRAEKTLRILCFVTMGLAVVVAIVFTALQLMA
jgi:type IV secretory pathway component VirB8